MTPIRTGKPNLLQRTRVPDNTEEPVGLLICVCLTLQFRTLRIVGRYLVGIWPWVYTPCQPQVDDVGKSIVLRDALKRDSRLHDMLAPLFGCDSRSWPWPCLVRWRSRSRILKQNARSFIEHGIPDASFHNSAPGGSPSRILVPVITLLARLVWWGRRDSKSWNGIDMDQTVVDLE